MAQLATLIVSRDEEFRRQALGLLRGSGVPIGLVDKESAKAERGDGAPARERSGARGVPASDRAAWGTGDPTNEKARAPRGVQGAPRPSAERSPRRPGADAAPDLALVDIRSDVSSSMATIERLRASASGAAIFVIANQTDPDLILQAMRAGANEFFCWPRGDDAAAALRALEEGFHGAVRRAAARRDAAGVNARPPSESLVFLGAKGGAGTTTVAVNCAVEVARLSNRATVIVDLKSSLGEVGLFLGVRPRFTVLDAIENLHRLDRDFLRELAAKHKSGLDILAGSEQFDRPNGQDAGAIEELLRVLARFYDFVVVDAGNLINACTVAALYSADTIFLVANPDIPSIRNAQRLVDRVRQLGAGSERVRVLLNRVSEQHLIAPKQIETALGYGIYHTFSSDYGTVSTALNSGVPLALVNHSDIAREFDHFTRQLIGPTEDPAQADAERRKGHVLGLF